MKVIGPMYVWWLAFGDAPETKYKFNISAFKVQENAFALPHWVLCINGLPIQTAIEANLKTHENAYNHLASVCASIYRANVELSKDRAELHRRIGQRIKSLHEFFEDSSQEITTVVLDMWGAA